MKVSIFQNRVFRYVLISVLALLVLSGVLLGGLYAADPYGFRMAPGVSVGGLDVSGMTLWEARSSLKQALAASLYQKDFTLTLPQEVYTLSPESTHPKVNIRKAVREAFRYGRRETQTEQDVSLVPYLTFEERYVRNLLTDYAARYDTDFVESSWEVTGDVPNLRTDSFDTQQTPQTLTVSLGLPDAKLDVEGLLCEIRASLAQAIPACDPFSLTYTVPFSVVPQTPDWEQIYHAVCTEPVNDSLDMQVYQFVNGSYGQVFSIEEAESRLQSAGYGDTISIPLHFETPEILGEDVYFRDVLGTCDTKHNSNENRNTNLRILCATLDGFVLQPGETFSYNGVLGERTREKGYLPAPAYSGNRLVDAVGGGVCQGSTTLYNCVLLADLEVVFRVCHGAPVSYVPRGLDAAVNYLTTDFQFRNNFHFPVKIQAEVSDGYVRMKLLGTDEKDYYIKMESRSGEEGNVIYSRSYKCKYSKETDELISREIEARSTYYTNIG